MAPESSVDTEYVILERGAIDQWVATSTVTARSAKAAIREAIAGDNAGGTFVAVPTRSWRPVKVTPKVETTLVLEDAS